MKPTVNTERPTVTGPTLVVRRLGTLCLLVASALVTAPVPAQRGDDANEERDCINLREIDRTRAPNDDTILFYMRGGDVYRNDLRNRCPNLDFDERFMYRVTLDRLCASDVITVIDDVGFGFMPGATCGLGTFSLISEEDAEQLTAEKLTERRRDRNRDRN